MSGSTDAQVLEHAHANGLIVLSHDVNTLRGLDDERVVDGRGVAGVLLTGQTGPTRDVANSLVPIWTASEAEEWCDRVVFIPFEPNCSMWRQPMMPSTTAFPAVLTSIVPGGGDPSEESSWSIVTSDNWLPTRFIMPARSL